MGPEVMTSRRALRAAARRARHRARMRSLLLATLTVALTTVVGISTAGGTYAWLTSSGTVSSATAKSATAGLTINDAAEASMGSFVVAPTTSKAFAITVKNTSTLATNTSRPLQLTPTASVAIASSATINSYATLAITAVASTSACTTTTGTLAPMSTFAPMQLGTLQPGGSQVYCVRVGLASNTPAASSGQSVAFSISLAAAQGT